MRSVLTGGQEGWEAAGIHIGAYDALPSVLYMEDSSIEHNEGYGITSNEALTIVGTGVNHVSFNHRAGWFQDHVTISNLIFEGNIERGLDLMGGTLTDVTFLNNASEVGGGLTATRNLRCTRCIFDGNRASVAGGGVSIGYSEEPMIFEDSVFYGNVAPTGGAIFRQDATITSIGSD